MYVQYFFFVENRTVCEKMWKNTVETGRAQMTILRMPITCRVPQAIDTLSEYEIIINFPLQKWLRESASVILVHSRILPAL